MPDTDVWALILAGISLGTSVLVAPAISHWFSLRRMRHELQQGKELAQYEARVQYQLDAQRTLAETVGASKSQIIDAAYDVHRRFENLAEQVENGWAGRGTWLAAYRGEYGYYFVSFIYRIVRLIAWNEILSRSLTYVDRAIPGADEERDFLKHLRVISNSLSETRLFDDLPCPYDTFRESAHIFADNLVSMAEEVIQRANDDGRDSVMERRRFHEAFNNDLAFRSRFQSLIDFLDGFDVPTSAPLKWSRMVAVHYCVALLLERFGYDFQRVANPQSILGRLDVPADAAVYSAQVIAKNLALITEECGVHTAGGEGR